MLLLLLLLLLLMLPCQVAFDASGLPALPTDEH
jgi:hypothetical protein